ncbi:MAG: chorismate-binding protein, partial [Oscillospiraceae bacterium]|nr:chorismate-binding protein [Oscillospiraceae bacterium]
MIKPTLEEAKTLSRGCTVVPIMLEIFSDQKTPIEVLRNIRAQGGDCFILESVNGGDSWGRYSFLGYKPSVCAVKDGAEPIGAIRELIAGYKSPRIPGLPPFTGGFVGYFAYDFVRYFIPGLTLGAANDEGFRDYHLMLVDKAVVFDHFKQKICIIVNISVENLENSYIKGVTELKDIERAILGETARPEETPPVCGEFTPLFTEAGFAEMVEKVKAHIVEGDIFQAVVSNRFTAPFKGSLLSTYRLLRTINPSP